MAGERTGERTGTPVVIEAAVNGGRVRREHLTVPYTPAEIAAEAVACAAAGAAVVHLHARTPDGGWTADPAPYAEALRRIRAAAPDLLVSITSLRPADVPVEAIVALLAALATAPETKPDLVSINSGHIAIWEPVGAAGTGGRRTVHYPNGFEDIAALLAACHRLGIGPELGVMDLGFVSNAVALWKHDLLPEPPWCLVELDSPGYGAGPQVAPAAADNYAVLADRLGRWLPAARWAAHGNGLATYPILDRALAAGQHIRVGFEDCFLLPDGSRAARNAELVAWAVGAAALHGRRPATPAEARVIIGLGGAPARTRGGGPGGA